MASGYILQLGFTQDIFLGQLGVSGVLVFFKNLLFFHYWGCIQEPGCISKYGKSGYAKMKNSNRKQKKIKGWLVMMVTSVTHFTVPMRYMNSLI